MSHDRVNNRKHNSMRKLLISKQFPTNVYLVEHKEVFTAMFSFFYRSIMQISFLRTQYIECIFERHKALILWSKETKKKKKNDVKPGTSLEYYAPCFTCQYSRREKTPSEKLLVRDLKSTFFRIEKGKTQKKVQLELRMFYILCYAES